MTGTRFAWGSRELTIAQWMDEPETKASGVSLLTLTSRLRKGWTAERAVTTPVTVHTGDQVDPRKASFYMPAEMVEQLEAEAKRLGWSMSRLVQRCVRMGMPKVKGLPSHDL